MEEQTKLPRNLRQTSPAAVCRDATPELYVQRDCVHPPPFDSAETGVVHTYDCYEAAPSVYAPPAVGTGSNPPDLPHLGIKFRRTGAGQDKCMIMCPAPE